MADYYVDGAVGNNGNAGTSEGSGNAWATIVYAATQVAAGDNVYIKSSATYSGTVTLSTSGTSTNPIYWIGYDTTITDDGMVTMDNSGTNGNGWSASAIHYQHFRNITVTDYGTGNMWNMSTSNYCTWLNCIGHTGSGYGIYANTYNSVVGCQLYDLTGGSSAGVRLTTEGMVVNTVMYNLGWLGIYFSGSYSYAINCLIYDADDYGIYIKYSGVVSNCTVDMGGSGIGITGGYSSTGRNVILLNNIVYDCATGIRCYGSNLHLCHGANNLLYSNTSDYDSNWPAHAKGTDITGSDPLFTDEANGDYTLAAGSPARNAGADASGTSSPGMDIGAYQSADAGGRLVITG